MKPIFFILFISMCFSCQSQKVEQQPQPQSFSATTPKYANQQLLGKWNLVENYYIENGAKVQIGSNQCKEPSYWIFFEKNNAIFHQSFTRRPENCEQVIKSSSGVAQIEQQYLRYITGDVIRVLDIEKLTDTELLVAYKEVYNGKMQTVIKAYKKEKK